MPATPNQLQFDVDLVVVYGSPVREGIEQHLFNLIDIIFRDVRVLLSKWGWFNENFRVRLLVHTIDENLLPRSEVTPFFEFSGKFAEVTEQLKLTSRKILESRQRTFLELVSDAFTSKLDEKRRSSSTHCPLRQ